jgi:hypothetical protein
MKQDLAVRGRAAVTIEATVRGAYPAGQRDLAAKGSACAMNPDSGVINCDARLFAQIRQTGFFEIDPHQSLAILGLQRIQQTGNTLADVALERRPTAECLRQLLLYPRGSE